VPKIAYEKRIENIKDLIEISNSDRTYCNLDMKMLKRIRKPLMELDAMVGMKKLKDSIFGQITYYIQGLHVNSEDYLHTILYGAPGCGKTTVAKIIGGIFAKIGILSSKSFTTAQREDLVSGYLGQTALKTRFTLESAKSGVLFIDEIYSLGDREKKDAFAKECVDTINLFLSENKGDFMLIVAGYEKEIEECFFSMNPGLRRRFMWYHTIEPYTPMDLAEMFIGKVGDIQWRLSEEVSKEWVVQFFTKNASKIKYTGGDIEKLLTLCKIEHSKRMFGSSDSSELKCLNQKDIQKALENFTHNKDDDKNPPPPPGMYS
jgi:replication-associated recombination protein RarA